MINMTLFSRSRKFLLIIVLLFAFTSAESDESDYGKNVEVVKMVEEKTRIFQCSGDDVHWYYNDTLVEDSKVDSNQPNTLILSSVTLGDAGTYVCKNARNSVIKTVEVQVTLKCPDFTTVDEEALHNFLSLEHFNDMGRALEYGECLKDAVRALIDKQEVIAMKDFQLNMTERNLTKTLAQLDNAQDKLEQENNGYHVTMGPELVRIPPGEDLVVWCNVTDSEGDYTFSWFWTLDNSDDVDGYNFDWPPGLNKSNAISANHNYSKLHALSADIAWSGRFFCLVEKNGVDDAPRLYHVDVEVAYPIQSLHLIRNGKHSDRTVPIEIPHGSPLEVSCTATGEWAPPAVNMSAQMGEDQVIVNGSSSDPTNKTTTAILELDWPTINGKDVLIVCEAKDNHYGRTNITRSKVIVTNPIKSSKLIWNGTCLKETILIDKPSGTELEVNCTAIGEYAPPDTVNITAQIGKEPVGSIQDSYSDPKNKTTTVKLTISWDTVYGKDVKVLCEAKGERKSNPITISSIVKVSIEPIKEASDNTTSAPSESWGSFGTPTVFGGIATVLVVVVVIGVVVVAYRSRDKLRTWIMEKDAFARGGKGWIKYAKLPRDISEVTYAS